MEISQPGDDPETSGRPYQGKSGSPKIWLVIFISKKNPDLARTGIVYLFIVRFVR